MIKFKVQLTHKTTVFVCVCVCVCVCDVTCYYTACGESGDRGEEGMEGLAEEVVWK